MFTIDDERAVSEIKKAFFSTSFEARKVLNHLLRNNDDYKKACSNARWDEVTKMRCELVTSTFCTFNPIKFYRKYSVGKAFASYSEKNPSETYKFFYNVRLSAFREGLLKYEDAYSACLTYADLVPEVKDSLTQRFRYLFIDEVQDTSKLQLDVIDKLFDRKKVTTH